MHESEKIVSRSVMSDSLHPYGLQFTRPLCPWNSSGKNIEMGNHSLLQGIFLTQGSNPGLLHCRQILYHLSHQGSTSYVQQLVFVNPIPPICPSPLTLPLVTVRLSSVSVSLFLFCIYIHLYYFYSPYMSDII